MRTELIRKSLFCTAFLAGAFLFGCTEESVYTDVDGQNPSFELTTEHIRTLTGYEFTMSGKVSDKDGISSINLYCPELFLDKTINLVELYSEIQYEYDLSYSFTIPEENKGESFKVKVTITDLGGRTTEGEILITMDGDFTAPEFKTHYTTDIKKVYTDADMTAQVSFTATDDKGLHFLALDIPELGINVEDKCTSDTELKEGPTEWTFNKTITIPNEKLGKFKMYTKAVDLLGNEVVDSCNVIISLVEDYEKMYLADVPEDKLNDDIFGVPMLIDHTDVNQYRARYYCSKANTEIYFIPQRSSFTPIRIGVDKNDNSKLTLDADAEPIILEEANKYYEINIDLMNSTYTKRSYTFDEADDPWASYMKYGENTLDKWNDGGSTWMKFEFGWLTSNPTQVQVFTQDETNPHLFYRDKYFSAGEGMNFFLHNYHTDQWWNFIAWYRVSDVEDGVFGRFTECGDRYINLSYSGPIDPGTKEWTYITAKDAGTYRFYFDSHLGRAKLVKVNN